MLAPRRRGRTAPIIAVTLLVPLAAAVVPGNAAAMPSGPTVEVLVSEPAAADVALGDLHWHDDHVYAIRDRVRDYWEPTSIAVYPASGTTATSPAATTDIPAEWTNDGQAFNGPDAFAVAPDGTLFVRAPRKHGRWPDTSADGWGVARLDPGGTTSPEQVTWYPGAFKNELGGNSGSLAMEPDGSGLLLGGVRYVSYGSGGNSYGMVARLPLPLPADQQAGAEMLVSADGYDPDDSSTRHDPPFLASAPVQASTGPFLDHVVAVDAKGPYVYVNENGYDIHRVDRRTDSIVSICCGYQSGWDPPAPVEGGLATETHFEIVAGPVADRTGSVFFAHAGAGAEIWQIRPNGTIHRVAGGGQEPPTDGIPATTMGLQDVSDLDLDPDGNLYLTTGASILRLSGVAAADTAPSAPRDLEAESGVGTLDLSWSEPAEDGGQPITGYTVRVHRVGAPDASQDQVITVTEPSAVIAGLVQSASYDVSVAAVNSRGTGPVTSTTARASSYEARLAATPASAQAGQAVTLDATGSIVPAGSTFEFFCDVRFNVPATSTTPSGRQATCRYPRGSNDAGYGATVLVTAPDGEQRWHATTSVTVQDPVGTVEGSTAFAADDPDIEVAVDEDGGVAYSGSPAGAQVLISAAPGTFRPGSVVRLHRGDQDALQQELGSGLEPQGGFAVTWADGSGQKYDLAQPLVVRITPDPVTSPRRARRAGWDIGAAFQLWGQSFTSGVTSVVGTIGSALEFVGSKLSELWAAAGQSLATPNQSRTNDVHTCSSFLIVTGPNSYRCDGVLTTIQGVPTDRISALDAGSRVVSAGGANVVSAGGANVVSAGGANVVSAGGANVQVTLAANSVISAGGANVVSAGGANVVSAGGANVVSAGGANVVSAGGANVISAGGANLTGGRVATLMLLVRDPGFAFAEPADPTPPSSTLVLNPPIPTGGIYPHGTVVTAHVTGTPAGSKQVQRVGHEVTGTQSTAYTITAGAEAELTIAGTGRSTLAYEVVDDQGVASSPATVEIHIAAASGPGTPGQEPTDPTDPAPTDPTDPGPTDPTDPTEGPTDPEPVDEPSPQSISLSAPTTLTYGDGDRTVSASSDSGLPVQLRVLTPDVCVLTPLLRVVGAGTCAIEATQTGDDQWLPAPTLVRTITVARAPLTVRATGARMVRGGQEPLVAPDYVGLVAGDTPFDLLEVPACRALLREQRTACTGGSFPDYEVTFVDGRLRRHARDAAIVSAPLVHARPGEVLEHRVRVDGGARPRVAWEGDLPSGVRAVRSERGNRLRFVGRPEAPGLSSVRLVVSRGGRELARQTVVLRIW